MSFLGKVFRVLNLCFRKDEVREWDPIIATLAGTGCFIHACYAYGSRDQTNITIASKYQIFTPIGTEYAVNTTDGRQLIIPASLWYWQFDVPEQWNSLQVGKKYTAGIYGYRVPWLSMFPNIVKLTDAV